MLPTSPEGMTLQHARTVGLRQEKPLPLDEIVRQMRLDGYETNSRTARADLRETLRNSGQFIETAAGEWFLPRRFVTPPTSVAETLSKPRRKSSPIYRRRNLSTKRSRRRKSPANAMAGE